MEVEFTARQVRISKALRTQAEEGLERIAQILGKTAHASVTFRAQRHLQIAELTLKARLQTIVAAGESDTLEAALRMAIDHAEHQALRHRDRKVGNGKPGRARAAIAVHSFPPRAAVVEPHILSNGDAFALKPMTMEEAVKEAEFRDRDLLIFHNPAGDLFVLHRRRDGQMELVEIP
jgi:putative sigma-54 modulation protein